MEDTSTRRALTGQQRHFMCIVQDLIEKSKKPVTVCQVRIRMGRSDSRVRSYLKILLSAGYLCCVKQTKVKRYVPSVLWLEEIGYDLAESPHPFVGGGCEFPGCDRPAEDVWDGRCMCRDHIIGSSLEEDLENLRRQVFERAVPGSPGGMMLDEAISGGRVKEVKKLRRGHPVLSRRT